MNIVAPELLNALFPAGPHPSLGSHAETYGRFIGSWTGEYADRLPGGRAERGAMEVHFGWVLEGRAVQDVWIGPSRAARKGGATASTLRVFDPASEAWRVVWLNPAKNVRTDLTGRRIGADVIQLGADANGPIKWVFTNITPQSFVWQGLTLEADGLTWRLDTEFKFRRTA
jgi:hypothetical protein